MFHEFYCGNGQLMSRILYWNIFTVPASIYRTISSSFVDSHVMQEGVPRPPKNGWYYSFPTHTLQVWFFFWWSLSTQNHHKKIKDVRVCFPQFQSKHPRFFFTRHHFTYCIIRQCNIYLSPYFQIKPTPRHVSFLSPLLNPNILPPTFIMISIHTYNVFTPMTYLFCSWQRQTKKGHFPNMSL